MLVCRLSDLIPPETSRDLNPRRITRSDQGTRATEVGEGLLYRSMSDWISTCLSPDSKIGMRADSTKWQAGRPYGTVTIRITAETAYAMCRVGESLGRRSGTGIGVRASILGGSNARDADYQRPNLKHRGERCDCVAIHRYKT